jgi:hypothetical protein
MKKTLLLAAALACSGVAQAEIFFCETMGWSATSQDHTFTAEVDEIWIVDSDKGWKLTGKDDYEGVCEYLKLGSREVLECKYADDPHLSGDIFRYEFTIWLGSANEFVKLNRYAGSVDAYSGRCTKI